LTPQVDPEATATLNITSWLDAFEAGVSLRVRIDPALIPSERVIEMVDSIGMVDGAGLSILSGYDIDVASDIVLGFSGGTAASLLASVAAAGRAQIPGMPGIRDWGDEPSPLFQADLVQSVRDRLFDRPPNPAIQLRLLRIVERFGTNEAAAFLMSQAEAPSSLVRNNAVASLWRLARDPDAPRPPHVWVKRRVVQEIELLRRYQALEQMAGGQSLRHVFFLSELQGMRLQCEMRSFRLLGLLHARAVLHRAYLHYRSPQQRVRSNAVELLDQHLVDPDLKPFVALVERAEAAPGLHGPTETPVPGVNLSTTDLQAMLALVEPWLGRVWHWAQHRQGGQMSRDPMDMVFLLKGVPLLSDLSGEQLLPVADIVQQVHVEGGDLVFAEGQPGNHLYVILEGEVDVLYGAEVVAKLGVKECFGEMALLDSSPRSASVRARKDCELLAISRDDFQDLLDMHPALARGVIRVLTQRLRHATEQAAHDDDEPS
jgi:hypothetical protein